MRHFRTAHNAVSRGAHTFFQLVLGLLREIGDENAYQRHLTAHGLTHSGPEWRRFCDERWLAASKRAKCC